MDEQDKKHLSLIAQSLEPNAIISRNGYYQLEQALEHIQHRLSFISGLQKTIADLNEVKQPETVNKPIEL